MEAKFIKFLTNNNVYRQFMHNLAYVRKGKMGWNEYRDTTEEQDWILCAFEFDQSKEGHDFWFDLAVKWHKLLED